MMQRLAVLAFCMGGASAQFAKYPTCQMPPAIQFSNPQVENCPNPNEAIVINSDLPSNPCLDTQFTRFEFGDCCDADFGGFEGDQNERIADIPATALHCAGKLRIDIEEMKPGEIDACCDQCKCYGDPHCVSFEGATETWVTCDTRTYQDEALYGSGEKGACIGTRVDTVDHENECYGTNGAVHTENSPEKCVYNSGDWDWEEFGSRCQLAEDYNPSMNMYEVNGFKVTIFMGERGILKEAVIEKDDKDYHLNAKMGAEGCLTWYHGDSENPEFIDSDDLPEGWQSEVVVIPSDSTSSGDYEGDLKDVFWVLETNNPSEPVVSVQCLGYQKTRPDIDRRLNVKIEQGRNQVGAGNSEGFCASGEIAERPDEEGYPDVLCDTESAPYRAEFAAYCEEEFATWCEGTLPETQFRFSKWYGRYSPEKATRIFDHCKKNWCETRQLPIRDNDASVKECVDDVNDFKFEGAARFYPELPEGEDECVEFDPNVTPPEQCEEGVYFEYYVEETESWEIKSYIPYANYCADSVYYYRDADPELFETKLRFRQTKCQSMGRKCNGWGRFVGQATFVTSCYEVWNLINDQGPNGYKMVNKEGQEYSFGLDTCDAGDL